MKIAVQTIGFFMPYLKSNTKPTFRQMKDILINIKNIGYNAIHLSGFGQLSDPLIQFFKKTCLELNIKIIATHISPSDLFNNLPLVIKAQKEWSCNLCGIGSMPIKYQQNIDTYIEFSKLINNIGQNLKKHNIQFLYHMHAFEFIKYNNNLGLSILMKNTSKDNVKLLIDTYWAQYAGINSLDLIDQYADRINTIHLKDMMIVPTGNSYFEFGNQAICSLGEGNINFIPIINKLKDLNIEWIIVEQDTSITKDINTCYKDSLIYLKTLL